MFKMIERIDSESYLRDIIKQANSRISDIEKKEKSKVPSEVIVKLRRKFCSFENRIYNFTIPIKVKVEVDLNIEDGSVIEDFDWDDEYSNQIEKNKQIIDLKKRVQKEWNEFTEEVKKTAKSYNVKEEYIWYEVES